MQITYLPYDIHRLILSKIYSVEDHINYCEVANIECDFDLCAEIKKVPINIKEYYFDYDDEKYIAMTQITDIVYLGLYQKPKDPKHKFTIIDRKYFDGKKIEIFENNILRMISQYLCGAVNIYLCQEIIEKIDDELESIIKNLDICGNLMTYKPELAYDVGLFKMMLISDDSNNIYKRIYLDSEYDGVYGDNDIVENLTIDIFHPFVLKLNNLPNLKVLTVCPIVTDEIGYDIPYETVNIIVNNAPKLKIVLHKDTKIRINVNIPNILRQF